MKQAIRGLLFRSSPPFLVTGFKNNLKFPSAATQILVSFLFPAPWPLGHKEKHMFSVSWRTFHKFFFDTGVFQLAHFFTPSKIFLKTPANEFQFRVQNIPMKKKIYLFLGFILKKHLRSSILSYIPLCPFISSNLILFMYLHHQMNNKAWDSLKLLERLPFSSWVMHNSCIPSVIMHSYGQGKYIHTSCRLFSSSSPFELPECQIIHTGTLLRQFFTPQ